MSSRALAPFEERVKKGLSGEKILAALRAKMADDRRSLGPCLSTSACPRHGQHRRVSHDGARTAGAADIRPWSRPRRKSSRKARNRPELIGVFSGAFVPTHHNSTPTSTAQRRKCSTCRWKTSSPPCKPSSDRIYVNDLNLFGRTFRVIAQADAAFREDPEDVAKLRTRSSTGASVPLGTILSIESRTGPSRVERYNLYPAAAIDGDTAPGFSSGQALSAMAEVAGRVLPDGFGFEWTALAYQQILAGNTAVFIFPLCVLFVFLILAALYESWSLPLSIILVVPMCVLAALAGVWLRGMDNNILTQIGFVVLVGLACKNAILIVEFAKQREEHGSDRFEAAVEACRLRLRPILMTSFAFILGFFPSCLLGAPVRKCGSLWARRFSLACSGLPFSGCF